MNNVKDLVDAELNGNVQISTFRKTPTQTIAGGIWYDLSLSSGNPQPQYYANIPVTSIVMSKSDGGIFHGNSGTNKYLKQITMLCTVAAGVPINFTICDYLLYYAFSDMSDTDFQPFTNTTPLTRYTSGVGVQIMAVEVASQSGVGNPTFYVNYINQNGVAKTSPIVACNTQTNPGTIITSASATNTCAGPFIPLAPGDTGVRSITGVKFLSQDIGLVTFVLVKPIENIQIRGIDAPVERQLPIDFMKLPRVEDDAYLNLICLPNASLNNVPFHGIATFIWE